MNGLKSTFPRGLSLLPKLLLFGFLAGMLLSSSPRLAAHARPAHSPAIAPLYSPGAEPSGAGGASPVSGQSVVVEPSGSVSWGQMVEMEAEGRFEAGPPRVAPYLPAPPPRELPAPGYPESTVPAVQPVPLAPPALVDSFLGLEDNNASIPPDTMGAAGPDHLMVMLNTQVRIQDKTGGTVSTVSLDAFWTGGTGLSGDPFDPKLVYDSLSGRWLATVDADSRSASSAVWFAISDTGDPTGSWSFYAFDADPSDLLWADYPGLGVNSTWIAITNNMFTNAGDLFSGAALWVIDKSTALSGGPLIMTPFSAGFDLSAGVSGFVLKPAVTLDAGESTLYILDNSGYSTSGVFLLRLSQITGTGPSPIWSVVAGSPFPGTGLFLVSNNFNYSQIDADQLGTSTDVNTNDPRLLNVVYRNTRLWTTHSAGLPTGTADRTAAFWYEIDPTGMPSPIVQSGYVEDGAGTHYFFPSIAVNEDNDVALGFSYSDASQYVEAAYTGRVSTDPAGAMGAVTTCKAGEDSYVKDFGSGRVRWGDYSATVVDPTDDLTFWTLQEYAAFDVGLAASDDRWGTWWCRVQMGNFWQGDDTSDPTLWSVPANWSSGAVPTCTTDAVIPAAPVGGVFPVVDADASVRNLTIAAGATLDMSAHSLDVCGNFDNSGTFNSTGGVVKFSGSTTQNLTANVATVFSNLEIGTGTTLVETASADNVTVSGIFTNTGTVEKVDRSLGTGLNTFGLTGAYVDISTQGNLTTLQVDRVGSPHPSEDAAGGGADMLDLFYTLTPDASDQSFTLEVCLNYTDEELAAAPAVLSEANLRLCHWTGSGWVCPNRGAGSSTLHNTVCADNIDTLSDWTIGETGPTAVGLQSLRTQAEGANLPMYGALLLLLAAGVWLAKNWRRGVDYNRAG